MDGALLVLVVACTVCCVVLWMKIQQLQAEVNNLQLLANTAATTNMLLARLLSVQDDQRKQNQKDILKRMKTAEDMLQQWMTSKDKENSSKHATKEEDQQGNGKEETQEEQHEENQVQQTEEEQQTEPTSVAKKDTNGPPIGTTDETFRSSTEALKRLLDSQKYGNGFGYTVVDISELEYTTELGRGTAATVFAGLYKGKEVAIKVCDSCQIADVTNSISKQWINRKSSSLQKNSMS